MIGRPWSPGSFRGRLMVLFTVTLTSTVLVIVAFQLWFNFVALRQRAPGGISNRAAVLAASLEGPLTFDDAEAAKSKLETLKADSHVGAVGVYRANGGVFAFYQQPGSKALPIGPDGPPSEFHGEWIIVRVQIARADERLGTIALEYDMGSVYESYWQGAAFSILGAAVVVFLALLVVGRAERQLTGPVANLAGIATKVSQTGDYTLRAEGGDIEEVQRLATGFNTMMTHIETQSGELQAARDHLEQRVAERTAESDQRALQLRALAVDLTQTEERERRRLAYALHEGLQQLLVAARMSLNSVQSKDPLLGERVRNSADLIQQSIDISRSLTTELAPPVLYDLGFHGAMQWLARTKEQENSLRVHLDLAEKEEELDESIKTFLFRAVKELLLNVVKHADVEEATVRVQYRGDQVMVVVVDEGRGFEDEPDGGKFDRGFGLFSIRERLEFLGGRLEIESNPGKGSQLTLTAPRRPVPREGRQRDTGKDQVAVGEGASAPRRLRVLLVDDHKILRDGMAYLLNRHGRFLVVGEASTGAEAIELARKLKPNVVVMDVGLPGMSGIEATQAIAGEFPTMRIVGLSMHDGKDVGDRMMHAGAAAYITKGDPTASLVDTILRVMAA